MNRHLIDYSAIPSEPLGPPLRKEEEKTKETPWKPCSGHPDYLERTNAHGIREVTHKDHVPKVSSFKDREQAAKSGRQHEPRP